MHLRVTMEPQHSDSPARHLINMADPANFRRDGKRRSGLGRFLHKAAPVALRITKGAALGVLDGIPVVSQILSTVTADKHVNNFNKPSRILVGWSTVFLVGMAFTMNITGQIDAFIMLRLVSMFLGV